MKIDKQTDNETLIDNDEVSMKINKQTDNETLIDNDEVSQKSLQYLRALEIDL